MEQLKFNFLSGFYEIKVSMLNLDQQIDGTLHYHINTFKFSYRKKIVKAWAPYGIYSN